MVFFKLNLHIRSGFLMLSICQLYPINIPTLKNISKHLSTFENLYRKKSVQELKKIWIVKLIEKQFLLKIQTSKIKRQYLEFK